MKYVSLVIALLMTACYEEMPLPPAPNSDVFWTPESTWESDCGDGVCDSSLGETKYSCEDCGWNPVTGCPFDGGYCGDGICCYPESIRSCCTDCCPTPINPHDGFGDPGWIDPVPYLNPKAR